MKKITLIDLVIVMGFSLIVIGLGIKMRASKVITEGKSWVQLEKKEKPLEVMVNLNTASLVELEALPAIGPKTAQKIIDYRNQHGGFKDKKQIMEVSGIGTKTYEKIMEKIEI